MALERTLSLDIKGGKKRATSSLFDRILLSQLHLTKYSKTSEFSAKYVATLANADAVYSLTQYFKRRMNHMNRQYIFLYNKKTKTLLRLHAFMPNLTKNEFIGRTQKVFRFIIYIQIGVILIEGHENNESLVPVVNGWLLIQSNVNIGQYEHMLLRNVRC